MKQSHNGKFFEAKITNLLSNLVIKLNNLKRYIKVTTLAQEYKSSTRKTLETFQKNSKNPKLPQRGMSCYRALSQTTPETDILTRKRFIHYSST